MEYYGDRMLVQNPPMPPLEREELDAVYALPFVRDYHPMYEKDGGIPAIEEVKFSITHNRGCFGACNFCAIAFHQGRSVRSRSIESVAEEAKKAVKLGIIAAVAFVVISQSWLLYEAAESDWAGDAFVTIFANTPRLVGASLAVYAICQFLDVHLYSRWWTLTEKMCGDRNRFLWLRNNFSTLISQSVNTVLYNFAAFGVVYDIKTLISICIGGYVVFVITSICDTPAVYLARKFKPEV